MSESYGPRMMRFRAHPEITAYELAKILEASGFSIEYLSKEWKKLNDMALYFVMDLERKA